MERLLRFPVAERVARSLAPSWAQRFGDSRPAECVRKRVAGRASVEV